MGSRIRVKPGVAMTDFLRDARHSLRMFRQSPGFTIAAVAALALGIAAYTANLVNLTTGGFPEQIRAGRVSADYFRLFGAPVDRGRTFAADEDRPGGNRVVVLSHALWTRRFGSDPRIVGKPISIAGDPYVV